MRRLLMAAGLVLTSGEAFAADPIYSPTPAYDWSGLWVGGELGYVSGAATNTGITPDGMSGTDVAIHARYNHQLPNNVVWSPFLTIPVPTATGNFGSIPAKIDWAVVGGLRLGYAMDRWLPYVLAGGVLGGGSWNGVNATHTGYTLGLGIDYAVSDRWSVGARYAYVSMGQAAYGAFGSFGWNGHSVVGTLNFKLH